MTIRIWLQEERQRLGFVSPLDFAQQFTLPEKAVIDWEEGKGFPDVSVLQRMAEAGADVYYILTGRIGPRSTEESDLLSNYQRCPPDSQYNIREIAEKEAEEIDTDALFSRAINMMTNESSE